MQYANLYLFQTIFKNGLNLIFCKQFDCLKISFCPWITFLKRPCKIIHRLHPLWNWHTWIGSIFESERFGFESKSSSLYHNCFKITEVIYLENFRNKHLQNSVEICYLDSRVGKGVFTLVDSSTFHKTQLFEKTENFSFIFSCQQ